MPRKHNTFSTRDAKVALIDRAWSVSRLARELGRPRPTVSRALNGCSRFPQVQTLIKKELGL